MDRIWEGGDVANHFARIVQEFESPGRVFEINTLKNRNFLSLAKGG